jgi:hypothetical protein
MNTLDKIRSVYDDQSFLIADGLDDAVIGVDEQTMRLIYSTGKAIEILAATRQVSEEDLEDGETVKQRKRELAEEFFYHNILSLYKGEKTPIWCVDNFYDSEL